MATNSQDVTQVPRRKTKVVFMNTTLETNDNIKLFRLYLKDINRSYGTVYEIVKALRVFS